MTVHVITDSSSCLPPDLANDAGVMVVDIYTSGQGDETTTAALGPLELTAAYARLLERGNDDGVVALHLSKDLSSTWSNAVTAARVFDGKVRVIDTNSAGMVLGYAALKAAACARDGGDLQEVADTAVDVIDSARLWLYVHKLDGLRKGGRLSAGRSFLTTALAIKPILELSDGQLHLAAKTRTQGKAMDKLVDMMRHEIMSEAEAAAADDRQPRTMRIALHQEETVETATKLMDRLAAMVNALRSEQADLAVTGETDGEEPKPAPRIPDVQFDIVELSPAIAIHTGPGAIGLVSAFL